MSMSLMEYTMPEHASRWEISEVVRMKRWTARKRTSNLTPKEKIAEEIHQLRTALECLVLNGQAMTSEAVIEKSMELDLKIMQYMRAIKRQPTQ
jgi:hypothetical protein